MSTAAPFMSGTLIPANTTNMQKKMRIAYELYRNVNNIPERPDIRKEPTKN